MGDRPPRPSGRRSNVKSAYFRVLPRRQGLRNEGSGPRPARQARSSGRDDQLKVTVSPESGLGGGVHKGETELSQLIDSIVPGEGLEPSQGKPSQDFKSSGWDF